MKQLERAYTWLLLAPTILPVVIWGGVIYPYLVPKTLLFCALTLLSLAAFILLVAHTHSFFWSRLRHKETWIPAALLVLAYIASMFGIQFYHSFWSMFVRGDGLLTLSCEVASFYLILLSCDHIFFKRFLLVVASVASFVAVYGIGEWLINGGRIGSLLGNAAFFAGYLGIALFITLAASRTVDGLWRRFFEVGAVLQLIAIVLTATRGTIVALGVAAIAFLVYMVFKGVGQRRTWSMGVLVALVVFAGLFLAFRSSLKDVPFQPIARLASISTTDPDVASRLFIWGNMVGQIERSPLLGYGAEHIDVLFNRFYDPTQISEEWFDRSHNAYLDYAAQYGIGGTVLYLLLIGAFFLGARRLAQNTEPAYAGIFSLLALTYAVQNFFVFDTVSSFWLFLASLAVLLSASYPQTNRISVASPGYARPISWVGAIALILCIVPASFYPAFAAYDLAHAYLYQVVDPSTQAKYLQNGMAFGTYGDLEYGYEGYDMYVNHQVSQLSGDQRTGAYQETLSILSSNFNRYPYDARTALYLAHVLSLAPSGIPVDNNLLSSALERAITLSPKRLQSWYILVNLALTQANQYPPGSGQRDTGYVTAKDLLNKYISLTPNLSEPHFVLAELDFATADPQGAAREAALGKSTYRPDAETARRAAGYYEAVKDWANAQYFLADLVRIAPDDYTSAFDLAKVDYLLGDPVSSEKIVQMLKVKDPGIVSTDQSFLSAITAYEQSQR